MSEEWLGGILSERADKLIMSVKSPSGQGRSMYNRDESPYQRARRRFSQTLSDTEGKRQASMNAGRLTVATKRGIERATNRSDRTDQWAPDGPDNPTGASWTYETDYPKTDYHARRRRASGR